MAESMTFTGIELQGLMALIWVAIIGMGIRQTWLDRQPAQEKNL